MTPTPDPREVTRTIAQQLGETQPGPAGQIARIVRRLGPAAALALLEETKQIEAQGGMLLPDSSRRRTPGGVFFHLVKARISFKDRSAIFWPRRKQPAATTVQQPNAAAQQPTPAQPSAPLSINPI